MSILALPHELLHNVCSDVSPFDREAMAKTMNRALYNAVQPLLQLDQPWIKNARRMCDLFTPSGGDRLLPSFPDQLPQFNADDSSCPEELPRSKLTLFGLKRSNAPYISSSPPDIRSWKELDGSLEWCLSPDEEMAEALASHALAEGQRAVGSVGKIAKLVSQTKKKGLMLPTGFETFIKSKELHCRFPSSSGWYFELSNLLKAPPSVDGNMGGHMVRFHWDQQACAFAYLYLGKDGSHGVIVSEVDLYEDEETNHSDEEEDGSGEDAEGGASQKSLDESGNEAEAEPVTDEYAAEDFHLQGLSFEEYLFKTYFDGHLEHVLSSGHPPSKGLREYVQHVYRSPVEIEHLRDSSRFKSTWGSFLTRTGPSVQAFLQAQQWEGKAHYDQHHRD